MNWRVSSVKLYEYLRRSVSWMVLNVFFGEVELHASKSVVLAFI